jgi:hypothetical protein
VTRLEVVDSPADQIPGEILLVPLFADQRPLDGPAAVVDWRLDGAISQMILSAEVSGRTGECLGLQTNSKFAAPHVMLVGGGPWQDLHRDRYQALIDRLLRVAEQAGAREVALCLPPGKCADAAQLEAMVRTALHGCGRLELCRLSRVTRLY